MKKAKIAIVGASIAGSAAAIMLNRIGADVTVFEKEPKGVLMDRGAGIALPKTLVKELIALDMFDQSTPKLNVDQRIFINSDQNLKERVITHQPFVAASVHWGSVYTNFVKRLLPENTYNSSYVTGIEPGETIKLTINNTDTHEFDIVIFADGFHSKGRELLYPECKINYSGYIAWRGILHRIDPETSQRLKDSVPFYLYDKGHLLVYAIPRLTATHPENEYIVNWLLYEKIDKNHPLAIDKKEQDNIPFVAMKPEYLEYLHDLTKRKFPEFPRDIVLQTEKPFTQAIFDAWVPNYYKDGMAILGDASILVRPHVGAGSTKAIQDVLSLKKYLSTGVDIKQAFTAWGEERQAVGNGLYTLCRKLGDWIVTDTPHWDAMDKSKMDDMWQKIVADHQDWYQIIKV